MSRNTARESSITVTVRVRPFTHTEEAKLVQINDELFFLSDGSFTIDQSPQKINSPRGIRKVINAVDDKMLIFDPPETSRLASMQRNAFPHTTSRIREHRFVFDRIFDVMATQNEVYQNTTRTLIDSVLDGFNATVFAYGATGCGKTHTILGTPNDPGVIFLTMRELYQRIDELSDEKIIDVSLSFLEIYNETIRDLLNPEIDFKKLILQEDTNNKISVTNLSSHKPNSVEEVMELILLGNKNRTSSPTEANATSSRSHAVLQINVVQRNRTADLKEAHTFATFSIIDLAGSERAAATKNRGARLNEGANINKSLLALGNCINALCDPRRRNHVPYRDSKLTRLLKFSLGGNCKTVMIVCVSPSSQHYDETLNTLKYADRVKEIKTKLIRNQHNLDRHVGSYLKMITQQKQEIEELKQRAGDVAENTMLKQKQIAAKNISQLFENIGVLQDSLTKQDHEKWKKYFLLCKRKLLILQKIDCENLLTRIDIIKRKNSQIDQLVTLCEQLLSKIDNQIFDLESQYSKPSDIEYIFNESAQQMLKRMKENEGWIESYSLIFGQYVSSLRESLERDVLFNSSILFDHLVHDLRDFNSCKGYEFLTGSSEVEIKQVIASVEKLVNGEYDSAIETHTSLFMQDRLKEHDVRHKSKRHPHSPIETSPVRITKKPKSPARKGKYGKREDVKRRGRVSVADSSFMESDISMEDLPSKLEIDEYPSVGMEYNTILNDELDLSFDTPIDSPHAQKRRGFSNSKLSINLNNEPVSSKGLLLNKQASTKILHDDSFIPGPSRNSVSPSRNGISNRSLFSMTPTSIMETYNMFDSEVPTRNIESQGDLVE